MMKEIVIKIDEELYNDMKSLPFTTLAEDIIINGTPLPKGHGNLIDYDDLIAKLDRYGRKNVKYQLPYSPTIIFADKESDSK